MCTRNAATNLVSYCEVLTLVTFHFPTDQDGVRDVGSMEFLRPSGRDNTFVRTSACGHAQTVSHVAGLLRADQCLGIHNITHGRISKVNIGHFGLPSPECLEGGRYAWVPRSRTWGKTNDDLLMWLSTCIPHTKITTNPHLPALCRFLLLLLLLLPGIMSSCLWSLV